MAIETIFKNIADAIREKAGTSGLITPAQMPQAISDIPTGGEGLTRIEPTAFNYNKGYASGGRFYLDPSGSNNYRNDIYALQNNHKYLVCYGSVTGWYFRLNCFPTNPLEATTTLENGVSLASSYGGMPAYYNMVITISNAKNYMVFTKDQGNSQIPTYVFDIMELP